MMSLLCVYCYDHIFLQNFTNEDPIELVEFLNVCCFKMHNISGLGSLNKRHPTFVKKQNTLRMKHKAKSVGNLLGWLWSGTIYDQEPLVQELLSIKCLGVYS